MLWDWILVCMVSCQLFWYLGVDMMEFKDKVILITGASSGLGFNLAKFFLNKGAKIIAFLEEKKI